MAALYFQRLDPELVAAVKAKAAAERLTLTAIVREALAAYAAGPVEPARRLEAHERYLASKARHEPT